MTDQIDDITARVETMLARAMKVFDTTQEALEGTLERLKAEEAVPGAEIPKHIKEMNSALMLALHLEGRHAMRQDSGSDRQGRRSSTSTRHALRSASASLACVPQAAVETFLAGLSENALAALPWLFDFWALPHQVPPEGDWRAWVVLGGRGAGKTRAGAEWVRGMVEGATPEAPGRARRVALVGETYDQALAVMVKGESGLLACSPPDRRPRWVAGERRLVWPNGAEARLYSAHDPEALRGPQFDAAWADELAKWPKAQETWDMLQFGLRLGDHRRSA